MTIFCTRVYQNFSLISGITILGIISILWVTNPSTSGIENINSLSGKELNFWSAALFRQTISSISLSPSTSSLILLSCLFKMEVKFAEHDLLSIFHYFVYLFEMQWNWLDDLLPILFLDILDMFFKPF